MIQDQNVEAKLIYEFVDSIQQASGACSQLIHHIRHPGLIQIRDTLDLVKEGTTMASAEKLMSGVRNG